MNHPEIFLIRPYDSTRKDVDVEAFARCVYVFNQSVAAMIAAKGMTAENDFCLMAAKPVRYTFVDFDNLRRNYLIEAAEVERFMREGRR